MQTEKPTTATWRAIAGYARPYWKTLIAGGLLLTVGGFVSLVQPLIARNIVEALGDDETIRDPIIMLIGLIVLGALLSAFGSYLLERTAESVVRGARMRLIDKILWLRLPSMEKTQPGDLMSRVSSDTTLLRQAATYGFVQGFTQTVLLVGIVIMMAYLDLVLLGVTLAVMLVMGIIVAFAVPRIQKATKAAQVSVGAIGAELERVLGAFRTVKASGAEPRERAEMEVATQNRLGERCRGCQVAGDCWYRRLGFGADRVPGGARRRWRARRQRSDSHRNPGRLPALSLLSGGTDRAARRCGGPVPARLGGAQPDRRSHDARGRKSGIRDAGSRSSWWAGIRLVRRCLVPLPSRARTRAQGCLVLDSTSWHDCAGRTLRGGEDHHLFPDRALLPAGFRSGAARW